jgi:protein SCO1/2
LTLTSSDQSTAANSAASVGSSADPTADSSANSSANSSSGASRSDTTARVLTVAGTVAGIVIGATGAAFGVLTGRRRTTDCQVCGDTAQNPGFLMHTLRRPHRSPRHLAAGLALVAAAAVTLTACGSSSGSGGNNSDQPVASVSGGSSSGAVPLDPPFAKPAAKLTDNHGRPFDLVKDTEGKPTLVYFGYTHCPDVCPTTMADIGNAARSLPAAEQHQLRVIFVTTDPQRDTPQRLTQWLGAMDPDFIGLTGDSATIQAAARSVGIDVEKPVKEKDGSISVTHGSEVLAFSPKDDKAHFLYTAGVSVSQFTTGVQQLVKGRTP